MNGYREQVIPAAIQTRYSVDVKDVDLPQSHFQEPVVEVEGSKMSFFIKFKSASSNINVIQNHVSAEVPPVQMTSSEDEPHFLGHTVTKPVIQEVREVISPYRRVVQEIRPVVEVIKSIISKGDQNRRQAVEESGVENFLVQNLIDKRLYDGQSFYDLKYPSPNRVLLENNDNNSYNILYNMLKVYRDK
jgi:hypothetical protein